MARKLRRLARIKERTFRPRRRRVKLLSLRPGTTVHHISPELAVVVSRPAGGGGLGATIDVCKCVKTEFKCTTVGTHTTCKEVCTEWECTEVVTAQ